MILSVLVSYLWLNRGWYTCSNRSSDSNLILGFTSTRNWLSSNKTVCDPIRNMITLRDTTHKLQFQLYITIKCFSTVFRKQK